MQFRAIDGGGLRSCWLMLYAGGDGGLRRQTSLCAKHRSPFSGFCSNCGCSLMWVGLAGGGGGSPTSPEALAAPPPHPQP